MNRKYLLATVAVLAAAIPFSCTRFQHRPRTTQPFVSPATSSSVIVSQPHANSDAAPTAMRLQNTVEQQRREIAALRATIADLQTSIRTRETVAPAPTASTPAGCRSALASGTAHTTWHQRQIEHNQAAYEAISKFMGRLSEERFPTATTWYGDAWRDLTRPFRVGEFPTPEQRDSLVRLLENLTSAERKRVDYLHRVGGPAPRLRPGFCLGFEWEELDANLRGLTFAQEEL